MQSEIQSQLVTLIQSAIDKLVDEGQLASEAKTQAIQVERTKDASHGDFACNIAMQLAGKLKKNPRDIATLLTDELSADWLQSVSIAGPGFINFTLANDRYNRLIEAIINQGAHFGTRSDVSGQRILLEFVSANPTGPLHVGHGRGAAYGATLANILKAAGHRVDREYYVNDAGRQMDILAISVYLRYLEACQLDVAFLVNAYQADYVITIAEEIYREHGKALARTLDTAQLPIRDYASFVSKHHQLKSDIQTLEDRLNEADKQALIDLKAEQAALKQQSETHLDAVIAQIKQLLGPEHYELFFQAALTAIRDDIKSDLAAFGVTFDNWYSERSLHQSNKIADAIEVLQEKGFLYEKAGALWFKSSELGDDKDRVVRRENGVYTYFASDIAYHHEKLLRNYDVAIDILGADHHGYTARVRAALMALGHDVERFHVELVQFAVLYKDGQKMQMSTRSGQYVTLRDLRDLIGSSAARFFYVMRKPQQHMDFDLDLAVKDNKDNPLYYIQYAHARICSVLNKASAENPSATAQRQSSDAINGIAALNTEAELNLLRELEKYEGVILAAARDFAPHYLTNYLRELATTLHSYYDAGQIKFLEADPLQNSRFVLLEATKQVLRNGLQLCGVEAPEVM